MRPSSLPILKQSPKFVSGQTDFAEDGHDRHEALRAHFAGDDSLLDLLDDESAEGIRWAAEYIRLKAPLSDFPIQWESELIATLDDFSEMPGHLDAVCNLDIFDFKWRERDYEPQMAAYALAVLQRHPPGTIVRAHILFGQPRKAIVLNFDIESASRIVEEIIADVNAAVECRPSDYCGWCANRVTCEVLNKRAQAVAAGREDWQLEQYHASQITEPAEMAKALAVAKQIARWAKAVEFHAKEMVQKKGLQIPGWKLESEDGNRYVTDVQGAFSASGLPVEDFLKCCSVRFSSSKKDPNKPGIENTYKAATNLSLAAAKPELKAKFEPFVKRAAPKLSLVPEKPTVEETTEDTED